LACCGLGLVGVAFAPTLVARRFRLLGDRVGLLARVIGRLFSPFLGLDGGYVGLVISRRGLREVHSRLIAGRLRLLADRFVLVGRGRRLFALGR
jgi:hypothetical protein